METLGLRGRRVSTKMNERPIRRNSLQGLDTCPSNSKVGSNLPFAAFPFRTCHSIFPRSFFTSLRFFFASTRLRFWFCETRVFTRRLGATSAALIISTNRSRANSRLRAWDRVSCTNNTIAPSAVHLRPANRRRRVFTGPVRAGDRSASNLNSTAVDTLLTFWPPGPDARTKLSVSSQSAISMVSLTCSPMCPLAFLNSAQRARHPLRGLCTIPPTR